MNPNIITSSEDDVKMFLDELRNVLTSENFDLEADLDILLKKKSELSTDPFTTGNTMLALDIDREDVRDELLKLTTSDYYETFIDDKDSTLSYFYAFLKQVKSKDVYIKVKIRDKKNNKVFCVSFHFPRYSLHTNPYQV